MDEETTWNGLPAVATRVRVIVGPAPRPTWWCSGLEGQERSAVRVEQGEKTFYLDDEDGRGWAKVTAPERSHFPHWSLPVAREVVS